MKLLEPWHLGYGNVQTMPMVRQRPTSRTPHWIIVLVCMVSVALIGAYVYPPHRYSACYFFASSVCSPFKDWLPPVARVLTDDEVASHVLIKEVLSMPVVEPKNPKIAFMFLTPGSLPFEKLWEKFFLKVVTLKPCLWNGMKRPCYLFARKFYPETLDDLIQLFSNYTVI